MLSLELTATVALLIPNHISALSLSHTNTTPTAQQSTARKIDLLGVPEEQRKGTFPTLLLSERT